MSVRLMLAYNFHQKVRSLFSEYTDMLIAGDSSFEKYLTQQNYDDELEHLEKKYGLPEGRLYLAYSDGELAGCIGMKKIDTENCEMKRLYVKPQFRGKKIGEILIRQIIDDARDIGYRYMLLDTLPFCESAIYIYKKYGFYEIECYNDSPLETSIYMKMDL